MYLGEPNTTSKAKTCKITDLKAYFMGETAEWMGCQGLTQRGQPAKILQEPNVAKRTGR